MIGGYFNLLTGSAAKFPYTTKIRVLKRFTSIDRGFIRFIMEFKDHSELHVFEYVDIRLKKLNYSYHWQIKEKVLIKRWDNAPHHKEIKTFPNHVHFKEDVESSLEPSFFDILQIIDQYFSN